jgi:F-type H+-transporting ATPase subunit b
VVAEALSLSPILDAIDAREQRIAAELADADAKRPRPKERDEFQHKNEVSTSSAPRSLSKPRTKAKAERQRLLDEARQAADALSAKRQESLREEAHHSINALRRRVQQEVSPSRARH